METKKTEGGYSTYNYCIQDRYEELDIQEVLAYEETCWVFVHLDVQLIGVIETSCCRGAWAFERIVETYIDDTYTKDEWLELDDWFAKFVDGDLHKYLEKVGEFICDRHNKDDKVIEESLT